MPPRNKLTVVEEGRAVLAGCRNIAPDLQIGTLSLSDLEADLKQAGTIRSQLSSLRAQMIELRNQRDHVDEEIWDKIKRIRAGMKAIYGDDSSEYEMVGGTRKSERKPGRRKKQDAQ